MKQIRYRIGFCLFVVSLLTTLLGGHHAFAEQLDTDSTNVLTSFGESIDYRVNALNNIYFWEPCFNGGGNNSSGKYGSGACGQKLTASGVKERLKEAVKKFGGFAIDMQFEYGVPWEAIFFHLYGESSMGTTGISKKIESCGYYNAMGYIYSSSSLYGLSKEQMGDCLVYHGDNGALAAVFPSFEDMIASYYTDYARNGLYDSAFKNLDPNNYNLEGFLRDESNIYSAAGWDGRVPGYGAYKDVWNSIKDTIHKVAKEEGWPTSEQLAKKNKIPIGGKYPVNGDIKKQMNAKPHSLSACDKSGEGKSSSSKDDDKTDKESTTDSGSSDSTGASGTSYKINPNTPAGTANNEGTGGFWYLEGAWSQYPKTVLYTNNGTIVPRGTKIDKDFFDMPYIYADNYDFNYGVWPVKMKPNGKRSTRKYYWLVLPNEAYTRHMGDKYMAYFEKRKEPVYFIIYDVWSCEHHHLRGMAYCDWARDDPDKVNGGLANNSLGHFSERGSDANNQLGDALGKLTCLHRLTTVDKTLANESSKCSGSVCTKTETSSGSSGKNYPEHIQQTGHTCGPASMSMLATAAAGKEVTEGDVISVVGGDDRAYAKTGGAGMTALDKKVGEKYGFDVENVSYSSPKDAEKKMKEYLDKGYMLHFSGAGSYPFTQGGHYIGVFGWTDKADGKVMIADSNKGNKELKLHDIISAGLHYDFSVIKAGEAEVGDYCDEEGSECSSDSDSDSDNENSGSCSAKVLQSVDKILDLAAKNGSDYNYGGIRSIEGFNSILKNNAKIDVDCTGFASLVMYDAFGSKQIFVTADIAGKSDYVEIPRSQVQPGDIFAYNYGCTAHGGIVAEVKNGKVTKIAQTGAGRGYANIGTYGKNNNLGYTHDPNGINGNLRCVNGDATDMKFYRYKGCR